MLSQLSKGRFGQAMTEYALIGAIIAVICVPALILLGQSVFGSFGSILPTGIKQPVKSALMSGAMGSVPAIKASSIPMASSMDNQSTQASQAQSSVQTAGANGNLQAVQNDLERLQTMYAEQTDPAGRMLLAQLLLVFSKQSSASLGINPSPDEVTYALGDVTIVPMQLGALRRNWTNIQGSPEFRQLNAADQARLTQIMNDFQTQAQYFTPG